ncbi:unnamed protein product [Ectocarpus sp. CCAP 1310/34]|nr:unnamed protein product [Ectocarpus sp. CCAP 1310/34]
MRDHFRTVKKNIDANIIHHSGGVAAPRGGSGKFPYSSPLILPKCATMQNTSVRRLFDCWLSRFVDRCKCERCVEYNGTVEESEQRPTSFNAWDVGCLDRLPDYVSKDFPFILTHRSGIDIRLDRLADDLVHGKGFSAAAKHIRQAHTTKFMVYQLKYVSLADARRSSRVSLFGAAPVLEKFGSFDDTEKTSLCWKWKT